MLWEGPVVIEESAPGGQCGVGTACQCVTGRLATLEEIVDWQPYDRVGWRLAVPGLGPIAATADLDATTDGTHLRLRWAYLGAPPADAAELQQVRQAKEVAFARLAAIVGDARRLVGQHA